VAVVHGSTISPGITRQLKRDPSGGSLLASRSVHQGSVCNTNSMQNQRSAPNWLFRYESLEPIETTGNVQRLGGKEWSFDSPRSRRRERNN
jgi:hypothetical protein